VQEAITNVLKHAQASRLELILDYQADALAITVSDNGVGTAAPEAASTGHGLIGMRERVELFKGELDADTSSLGGFTVHATLPIA
jgi:signal transduction histidine kinase